MADAVAEWERLASQNRRRWGSSRSCPRFPLRRLGVRHGSAPDVFGEPEYLEPLLAVAGVGAVFGL